MEKIIFDHSQDHLAKMLGISDERGEELLSIMEKARWTVEEPNSKFEGTYGECLEEALKSSNGRSEDIYISFLLGAAGASEE